MVICIIRIHKKVNKRKKGIRPEKKDMHAHIEVNTVQSVCVNKRETKERETQKERERATKRKEKL